MLNRTYGGPEGIGFAIPVNLVRGVMEQILKNGHVVRGWLGFVPQDLTDEQSAQIGTAGGGVTVVNIMVKSPAYEAGVRPGDLITGLAGDPVHNAQDLVARVSALKPGASVELAGRHAQQPYKIKLTVWSAYRPCPTALNDCNAGDRRLLAGYGVRRIFAPSCCSFSSIAA